MIKITFESAGHPDYFRIVGAEMDKEYTAIEFIEEILKTHPKDYGHFALGNICYDYKKGVLDWDLLPKSIMYKVVAGVKGMSSYFNTDYEITLKDDESVDEKKSPSVDLMKLISEMSVEMREIRNKYEKKIGLHIHSVTIGKYKDLSLSSRVSDGVFGCDIVL